MHRKIFRILTMVLLLAFALEAPMALAAYSVKISKKTAVIDLASGNTLTLTCDAPASLKGSVVWKSNSTAIATVNNGVVTAKKKGTVQIGVRVKNGTWSICKVTITDSSAPKSLALSTTKAQLAVGETLTAQASLMPKNAAQTVKWETSKASVATVSPTGVITAKAPGTARIRATSTRNASLKKYISVTVKASTAPTSVSLSPATSALVVGDKLTLTATVSPSGTNAKINWTTSDATIATVSTAGIVTAKKAGKVTITATSAVKSTVRASRSITITDPNAVDSVAIDQTDLYLDVDKAVQLSAKALPSSSSASISWASSDTSVVAVTTDGKAVARKVGVATITAKAGAKSDNIEIRVLSNVRVTTLPERFVASSGQIAANHNKISAIFQSAVEELESNMANKKISAKERANRKEFLQRGFLMYDIPWSTDRNVRYWSGSTYYLANRIYFGMPYTQTSRTYNLDKWLKAVKNTKSSGYNQFTGMPDTNYPGNDCSSFVSMCQWGYNSSSSYLNSTAMYSSSNYTTVTNGFNNLIPGDILVKNGHVAMFLYYVNADRIMVLEQGGSAEPNTVACNLKSISGIYSAQGYRVRRKVGIAS